VEAQGASSFFRSRLAHGSSAFEIVRWHEKTFRSERKNARKNFFRLFSTRNPFAKMRAFPKTIHSSEAT